MTITISEITHATASQALAYAQDYYTNHYSPTYPPFTYHRYDHSEHIEVLASWGYQGYFFVQSRIKQIVLYGLPSEWTDEIAVRAWTFWRNPITETWHTEVDSQDTSVHHWQEAHQYHKEEETQMALKRARIDQYYPETHKADITIYPLPGEELEDVPLAEEIPKYLASQLPDCTLAIFYDEEPPLPQITAIFRTNALSYNAPFGYNDRYEEYGIDEDADAGGQDEDLSAVPIDEIWIINSIWGGNWTRGCNHWLKIVCGANTHFVHFETTAGPAQVAVITGAFVLKYQDFVRITWSGLTGGDTLKWGALGYKMKI